MSTPAKLPEVIRRHGARAAARAAASPRTLQELIPMLDEALKVADAAISNLTAHNRLLRRSLAGIDPRDLPAPLCRQYPDHIKDSDAIDSMAAVWRARFTLLVRPTQPIPDNSPDQNP